MSQYVAAYDISHPGQRAKVARALLAYGMRIQQSVYHVELEPAELPRLQREVGSLLAVDDKFDLLPVDSRETRHRLCWQQSPAAIGQVVIL